MPGSQRNEPHNCFSCQSTVPALSAPFFCYEPSSSLPCCAADGMEVRLPRAVAALAWLVYPLEEPQLAAMTPSHVRRAQLVL